MSIQPACVGLEKPPRFIGTNPTNRPTSCPDCHPSASLSLACGKVLQAAAPRTLSLPETSTVLTCLSTLVGHFCCLPHPTCVWDPTGRGIKFIKNCLTGSRETGSGARRFLRMQCGCCSRRPVNLLMPSCIRWRAILWRLGLYGWRVAGW